MLERLNISLSDLNILINRLKHAVNPMKQVYLVFQVCMKLAKGFLLPFLVEEEH